MTNLNVIEATRFYINRMIEDAGQSVKGLVMDKETVSTMSIFLESESLLSTPGFDCQHGVCSIRNSPERSLSFRTH